MRKAVTSFLWILALQPVYSQSQPLFRITENDKIGYINSKGDRVIEPQFPGGGDFSDGMAPVRDNGLYGFINGSGDFIINPQFDFASSFYKGIAAVYKKGVPAFINTSGKKILPSAYKGIDILDNNKAIVTTYRNRRGLVDLQTGKLLADTIFSWIRKFKYGVAIVQEYIPTTKRRSARMGVLDSTGKLIVPLGKYRSIEDFVNGFAIADLHEKKENDKDEEALINTKGEILFTMPSKWGSYAGGEFSDGFAKFNFYGYVMSEDGAKTYNNDKQYFGYMDMKGQVAYFDSTCQSLSHFSNGRAFIRQQDGKTIMIDRNFKQIGTEKYRSANEFRNNYAIVDTDKGWGIIDTSGNFIIKPQYVNIHEIGVMDNYFFFGEWKKDYEILYGIADLNNDVIIKPTFEEFDANGFINGLLQVMINGNLAYINKKGEIIWRQPGKYNGVFRDLNIDYMNRGYFYASSSPGTIPGKYEAGGYAESLNYPKKITGEKIFNANELAVKIDVSQPATYNDEYFGYKLFISNTTGDTIAFNAQDGRLYVRLQAQDTDGKWKDIEYLPSSWCGNSYHRLKLEPNAYWSFTIPGYKGAIPTHIRARLEYIDKNNRNKDKVVYSNIIGGSVNPGQFWNKIAYYPAGIMDPYID